MFFEHFLAHRGVGFWTPVFDRSQRFRFIVRYEKRIDAHDDDDWRTKRLLLLFLSCFTKFDPILSRDQTNSTLCCASSRRPPKKVLYREHHHHRRRHTKQKALGRAAALLLLLLLLLSRGRRRILRLTLDDDASKTKRFKTLPRDLKHKNRKKKSKN